MTYQKLQINAHTFPKIKEMSLDVTLVTNISPEVLLVLQEPLLHSVPRAEAPSVELESWRNWVSGGTDPV